MSQTSKTTNLLIIGAGPYGLAMGLYAQQHQIDYVVVGKVMDAWETKMPREMRLRTPCDWGDEGVLEAYLEKERLSPDEIKPVPLKFLVNFIRSIVDTRKLRIVSKHVEKIDRLNDRFEVLLEGGEVIVAENVLVATGYYPYRSIPEELKSCFPQGRFSHNADCVDFQLLSDKRCLVIGGRQGAFEWSALARQYVQRIDIVYRHKTPDFVASDWSWVYPYIDRTTKNPGWYRLLTQQEKDGIDSKFWFEGRAQLEDWLLKDIKQDNVHTWPMASVNRCEELAGGELEITLSNGSILQVDHIILATGYQVDVQKLPFLQRGNLSTRLLCKEGFPVLDTNLQSNLAGLYFTGINAVKDFGPFFFFVAGSFAAAQIVGRAIGIEAEKSILLKDI